MALTELRIASRRSQLAMVQTNWVKAELEQAHPGLTITVEAMATQGLALDRSPDPQNPNIQRTRITQAG